MTAGKEVEESSSHPLMYARELPQGLIAVHGKIGVVVFANLTAGMTLPDLEPGYMCVVGLRADGRYHCLWESRGGGRELAVALKRAKQEFFVETAWVQETNPVIFNCGDESAGRSGTQTLALLPVIAAVPSNTSRFFRSGLEWVRNLLLEDRLLVYDSLCPQLLHELNRPLDRLLTSPVIKALVWAVTSLQRGKEAIGKVGGSWYDNLPRRLLK